MVGIERPAVSPARREFHALIVDDDAATRTLVSNVLVTSGLTPHRIERGSQVALALARWSPDLIVLDLSLGDSDAIEVIRMLGDAHYGGQVILISGRGRSALDEVQLIGTRHGLAMLPPLEKPFRVSMLRDQLRQIVAQERNSPLDVTLEAGLKNNWLELWYQPKVDLRTRMVCGAEALIRLRHPELGIVLPGIFLPPPGDILYRSLTNFIALRALADWTVFAAAGLTHRIAINVPASVLQRVEFVDVVRRHLPNNPAFPGLIVEITEEEAISDPELAREIAVQLQLYNIQVSIDDFGSGFSSLARLKEIPFAEIKLDRSYVLGCANDPAKRKMCEAVVDLARRFDMVALAEGVENRDDLMVIKELGFDVAQGFLFARPMPANDFVRLIAARARVA